MFPSEWHDEILHHLTPPHLQHKSSLCPEYPAYQSLISVSVIILTVRVSWCLCSSTLFYLIMAPKCKRSVTGNSDMPKRSHKVLPLCEKLKGLGFIKEEKIIFWGYWDLIERTNLLVQSWRRKKIHASFAVTPQTTKVTPTICNSLSLSFDDIERERWRDFRQWIPWLWRLGRSTIFCL